MTAPVLQARALVVDDDETFAAALKRRLETAFSDVDCALSEAQAWTFLEANRYDVIFLDLMLERDAAGLAICRRLRSSPRWRSIPVFVVTSADLRYGLSLKSYLGEQECLPANDFLDKGTDLGEIVQRAREIVERSGPRNEPRP